MESTPSRCVESLQADTTLLGDSRQG